MGSSNVVEGDPTLIYGRPENLGAANGGRRTAPAARASDRLVYSDSCLRNGRLGSVCTHKNQLLKDKPQISIHLQKIVGHLTPV